MRIKSRGTVALSPALLKALEWKAGYDLGARIVVENGKPALLLFESRGG